MKKFKQTLFAYENYDENCFLGQESRADGGINATRDHHNVISGLQSTKQTA
jgi:hypothetical protein